MPEERLLVLDDEFMVRETIRLAAQRAGIEAELFASAAEFEDVGAVPDSAVIMIDLRLGNANGVDVLRLLAERRCRAKIVVMSGAEERILQTTERLGKAYGLNMLAALTKPFQLDQLVAIFEAARVTPALPEGRCSAEGELRRAIMGGELRLHYQPKVDFKTGAILGSEALVRWQHPERGMVPPLSFIPIAEETGLILPLTEWVLGEALRQTSAWRRDGFDESVSINIPGRMLNNLAMPDMISGALASHTLPGSALTLEVTEAEALKDMVSAMDVLARLRLMDVTLSIDDFGTGHSSLTKLRQLPFNELKIDRSFVMDALSDSEARALTETVILLAHRFGIKVVAEGVENAKVWDLVGAMGCDTAQGYFISRPLPADGYQAWRAGRLAGDAAEPRIQARAVA